LLPKGQRGRTALQLRGRRKKRRRYISNVGEKRARSCPALFQRKEGRKGKGKKSLFCKRKFQKGGKGSRPSVKPGERKTTLYSPVRLEKGERKSE